MVAKGGRFETPYLSANIRPETMPEQVRNEKQNEKTKGRGGQGFNFRFKRTTPVVEYIYPTSVRSSILGPPGAS